jgi:Transposase
LLRVVRRRAHVPAEPLNVIGIDDWAWRRNHRYGTIVCDLERRRPVKLLPDREPATAIAWLKAIKILPLSPVTVAADTVKRLPGHFLKPPRSLIVGT